MQRTHGLTTLCCQRSNEDHPRGEEQAIFQGPMASAVLRLLVLAVHLPSALAVNKNNFKTCEQARFCKNHRNVKPEKAYTLSSPLTVDGSR